MATEGRDPRILYLLHTVDSIYPTGAYAHSFGLEGLVQDRAITDTASLETYLHRSALPALARVDLPLVRLSHEAGIVEDADAIHELAEISGALKGSRELREASARVGGQRLALAADLFGHPLLVELRADAQDGAFVPHANVVFGVETAVAAVGCDDALAAYAYQTMSGSISAAMKLIRLGQNAAQRVLRGCLKKVPEAVATSRAIGLRDIGWFSPLLDTASARHEGGQVRIFIS